MRIINKKMKALLAAILVISTHEFYETGSVRWGIPDPENAIGIAFTLIGKNNSSTAVAISVAGTFGL